MPRGSRILPVERLDSILDVGTGSGILALAALKIRGTIDADALQVAAENARLNNLADRLQLVLDSASFPVTPASGLAGVTSVPGAIYS